MDSTVAVALIAVGGTFGSAALSYLGTRRSTKVQIATSADSTKAQLRSVEADIQRVEREQEATARDTRQRLYQDFLATAYAFRDQLSGFVLVSDIDDLDSPSILLRERRVEIELLGSEKVIKWTKPLHDLLAEIHNDAIDLYNPPSSLLVDRALDAAYAKRELLWKPAKESLLKAMRAELKPAES